jgi:AcrR family transcriptional regulator
MPKISEARRAERRDQILNAAWACFQRQGLHATTMDDIIRACGLSAGAVYGYFPSKNELILAAVTTSLSGLQALLAPIIGKRPPDPPDQALEAILARIAAFTERGAFDLKRIALLGWSESQSNPTLRTAMQAFYTAFRARLAAMAAAWRDAGHIDAKADVDDIAKSVLALILGFVVEAAIMGDVEPPSIGAGLRGLTGGERSPAVAKTRRRADRSPAP